MSKMGKKNDLNIDWKNYELAVLSECRRIYKDANILYNTSIDGRYSQRKRQIDLLIKDVQNTYILDAKKYNRLIDVKIVESFIGMIKDVGVDYGIIVSEKGFTKAAIKRAHLGEDNIEVDILSMKELKQLQGIIAIPYIDNYGIIINSPFGWIVDGESRENMQAILFQRGLSFEEAIENKEWAYINAVVKDKEISSEKELVFLQNQRLLCWDKNGKIEEKMEDGIRIRIFESEKYPTKEITLFREFQEFVLFVVLFSPDYLLNRNIRKIRHLLMNAIPIEITHVNNFP